MALLIDGEIHFSGPVASFKNKVDPGLSLSLEDSYLQYVQQLVKTENTKED